MKKSIDTNRLGELPARYSFVLNPYAEVRFSRCTICKRLTHFRKFALLIHVKESGLVVLGKTCRYCTKCEVIIAHKNEVEDELNRFFSGQQERVGNDWYLIIGIVGLKTWRKSLQIPITTKEILKKTADFKEHLSLEHE